MTKVADEQDDAPRPLQAKGMSTPGQLTSTQGPKLEKRYSDSASEALVWPNLVVRFVAPTVMAAGTLAGATPQALMRPLPAWQKSSFAHARRVQSVADRARSCSKWVAHPCSEMMIE